MNNSEKKTSKDLWLVLIFVDIIALCIFSYFIYASFANAGKKAVQIRHDAKTEEVFLEEIDLSEPEISLQQEPKKELQKETSQEVKQEKIQEKTSEVKPQVKEEKKEEVKETQTPSTVKQEIKESFKISGTGKWRKVTFRYFDEAKNVAIVSGFTMRKPQNLKKVKGIWETTLTIAPGTYKYMFIVDGKELKDPYNRQEENGRSVIIVK